MNSVYDILLVPPAPPRRSSNTFSALLAVGLIVAFVWVPLAPAFGQEATPAGAPPTLELEEALASVSGETSPPATEEAATEAPASIGSEESVPDDAPAASSTLIWATSSSQTVEGDDNEEENILNGGSVSEAMNETSTTAAPGPEAAEELEDSEKTEDDAPDADMMEELRRQIRQDIYGELGIGIIPTSSQALLQSFQEQLLQEMRARCLNLDGGGFYCPALADKTAAATSSAALSVYSAADQREGDQEVYLKANGQIRQLSDNAVDDIFPAHNGDGVVWQSFVGGRWQVMWYDLKSTTATQVTASAFNSMNPQTDGETVVWQSWVDGNWEVFLAARQPDSSIWVIRRLTTNDTHDMFPKITAGIITWQSLQDDGWQVFVYDVGRGETRQLSRGTGIVNEHPRFMIVWERRDVQGKAELAGYDLASGELINFGQVTEDAAPPLELPEAAPPLPEAVMPAASAKPSSESGTNPDGHADE